MPNVIRTKQFETDYREILDYLHGNSPIAATRFINEVETRITRLAVVPGMGRPRPEFGPVARSLPIGKYILIYDLEPSDVVLLHLIHGSRDIPAVLRERDDDS